MNQTFLAVRAIGAEFARQLWVIALIWASVVVAVLIALQVWLVSINTWWWLLAIPLCVLFSITAVLLTVFQLLIRRVRPTQNPHQKKQVKRFVKKLQFVTEVTSTPKIIILFRTIRSIAAPKSDRYLQDIFETKDLKDDFFAVVRLFKEKR